MMSSSIRVSPFAIFCFVCALFVILYTGKYIFFPTNDYLEDYVEDDYVEKHLLRKNATSSPKVSMKALLEISILLAEKGGAILKTIREKDNLNEKSKGLTKEGVVDPVTQGDMLSHTAIVSGFRQLLPNVPVISEEHDDISDQGTSLVNTTLINDISDNLKGDAIVHVPAKDLLVWIDPLDATKEYTENLREYVTTMVCITVNGAPVAGVIHQPFLVKTSWAWVDHGHSKGLEKPSGTSSSLTKPRIIVSQSHAGSVNQTAIQAFGQGIKVIPAGGAGFKVLSLFDNTSDAYIHKTLIKKWDICAGHALLRSFGGKMTTLEGKEISYGDKNDVKNTGGLLATLYNHKHFLEKLSVTEQVN